VEYKRLNKTRRLGFVRTMNSFPESVGEFVKLHPIAYSDTEPPVESRFMDGDFDRARSKAAAKKTHKTVSGSASSSSDAVSQLSAFASALMALHRQPPAPLIPILTRGPHRCLCHYGRGCRWFGHPITADEAQEPATA
jgi:hypothetical protein